MLGTKCPSITSRWIQSAPAWSTARTSSASLAKSEARIDGAMTRGRDANCWDMCAFRKSTFEAAPVTRANPGRNVGKGRELRADGATWPLASADSLLARVLVRDLAIAVAIANFMVKE